MSTSADLAETARAVEARDRRIAAAEVDVRDLASLRAAVVLISSTQGLTGRGGGGDAGGDGYCASKHGVVGLMRTFAHWLAPHGIRVNTVHPTGVDTPMINNGALRDYVAAHPAMASAMANLIPVPWVQPIDVANAVAWLVTDTARYVTGVTLPVDAGFAVK